MRIRGQIPGRSLLVVASCTLVALAAGHAGANSKDTPELVMQGAGQTLQHTQILTRGMSSALTENNAFLQHLQTDRAYAADLLAAGQKSDRAAIVSLMRRFSPSGEITVTDLNPDFTYHFKKVIKLEDGQTITVEGCVSTTNSCNGGFASVTAK
jgi:hypothetical protein